MDLASEYVLGRKSMSDMINSLPEENIVLRNKNMYKYKERENKIFGQKLKENKQVWSSELVNLKEELNKIRVVVVLAL